jgi:hypothetical protein
MNIASIKRCKVTECKVLVEVEKEFCPLQLATQAHNSYENIQYARRARAMPSHRECVQQEDSLSYYHFKGKSIH